MGISPITGHPSLVVRLAHHVDGLSSDEGADVFGSGAHHASAGGPPLRLEGPRFKSFDAAEAARGRTRSTASIVPPGPSRQPYSKRLVELPTPWGQAPPSRLPPWRRGE